MLLFLTYRARNEQDRSKWEQILDENVSLVMPITPYRFFFKNEISGNIRKLSGENYSRQFVTPLTDSKGSMQYWRT